METNSGKQGGNLKGKPHYDEKGNPVGGIKAVVTDGKAKKPVELEDGEVIINAEAAKKHWKKLSEINQSAGNGVPIHNPNSVSSDEDPEEYKDGGKVITFNRNHIPKKSLVRYVSKLKSDHPEIWKLGGNIFGNEAFVNLKRVSDRGYWLDSEKWMYIKWRSYVARHKHDFRIEGVVAMLKWVDTVDKGLPYMRMLIETEKKRGMPKPKVMKAGGSVSGDVFSVKDPEQFKHIISIYNFFSDNFQADNYFIDHNDNSIVIIRKKKFTDAELQKMRDILLSGKYEGYSLIDSSKKVKYPEGNFKFFLNKKVKFEQGGKVGFENELFNELADQDNPSFDKGGELKIGIVDEKEHLGTIEKIYNHDVSPDKAPELIAKDHLKEDPNYYTKLNKMEQTMDQGGNLKTDSKGNYIGDGSIHADYYVFDFSQYPQIVSDISFSETTESVYVTYINTQNDKRITVRYSDHVNNATLFGDQLDGNRASKNEILYRLDLLKRRFVPLKKLQIDWIQPKKKELVNYEIADKTIKEMYDLGAGADISMYKGKLAKDSSYLITGETINEITEGWKDTFGNYVTKGDYIYEEFGSGGNVFIDAENNIKYTVEKNPEGVWTIYSEKDGEWDKRDEYPEGFASEEDAILVANHISGILGEFENLYTYKEPKRYDSKIEVGQRYYDKRYGDSYTIEKIVPVEGGDVDVTLKYDKGKTRNESGNFILYHIDAKQHTLSLEETSPIDEQNKNIRSIRELGTGSKVYFETPKYRVNEYSNKGDFMLNVGMLDSEGVYNFRFDNLNEAIYVAEYLSKSHPNGIPDAVLIEKVVDGLKDKFKGVSEIQNPKPTIDTNVSSYKNAYAINRAIEALIDQKGDEQSSYTADEIKFLSYYSGYGGLEKQGSFSQDELKGILYEYYTPDEVVKKMWGLAYKYGYGSIGDNSVFEPSCGTGAFIKYAPENVIVAANEINKYSATICEILYPHAQVALRAFETNFIKQNLSIKGATDGLKKYSLVIGNPPYGRLYSKYIAMGEDKYTMAANFTEYFITRGIDLLCKDGLLVFIVGAEQFNGGTLFLDSALTKTKRAIFDKADLIDAYRLPTKIFERTGVSTEILIFRKR